MFIKEIQYLSEPAREALLTISDGSNECIAFCQPCDKSVGEVIKDSLYIFEAYQIQISGTDREYLKPIGRYFRHEICATIKNIQSRILKVGSILLEIDSDLPGDISKGDKVNLICERIDIL
jgi:hypothetical protein